YNPQNEHIGQIEELMINLDKGEIGYAVLSVGGVLGIGEKYFAIPWKVLTVDQENKCLVLNVDKEKFEKAPGFDKDHWPDMTPEFTDSLNAFYKDNS
ncbi:MAG: PRC-barrel domain-containing protein, partial [Pseudomonadota bacterium]|nr:PRC-barrel domain-containing protein [Pseudomonadota bacterium]